MKAINLFTLIFFVFCVNQLSFAQNNQVIATITPDSISIGQQATISVEVKTEEGELVLFPSYKGFIANGVEVLNNELPIDTILQQQDRWLLKKEYTITSFDSLEYTIPPIMVIVGIDTLKSDSLQLKVGLPVLSAQTLDYADKYQKGEIDSLNFNALGVNDIKNIYTPPFFFMDYIEYIIMIGIIILFIILLIVLYILYRKKKKKGYYFKPEVVLPPDVVAMNALKDMQEKQLVQQGKIKEYHTELTDIVRKYIKDSFGVDAPEMLTKDVVDRLEKEQINNDAVKDLGNILSLADLVKFAKWQPLQHESDKSFNQTLAFIERTKPTVRKTEDGVEPNDSDINAEKPNDEDAEKNKTENYKKDNDNLLK